ncbi:unnamed protein product [Rotaria socialis]
MVEEVLQNATIDEVNQQDDKERSVDPSYSLNEPAMMDTSNREQHMNVVDDATLQTVLSSVTEPEVNDFLEELNKTGKTYLRSIGQTIELLTVPSSPETSTVSSTVSILPSPQVSQISAEILLQELTSLIQQTPADIVHFGIERKSIPQTIDTKSSIHIGSLRSRQTHTANDFGGTSVIGGGGGGGGSQPGTAVKSTITSSGGATIRKPLQQQQQQAINDDRVFFERPTTAGQGQYHNRIGLMSNKQQSISLSFEQQRRLTSSSNFEHHSHQHFSQRRPLSWFQNRSRHHSSGDDNGSDRDSSPPSYSMSGHDNLGPTRRSTLVPKPKQNADIVTFPLLDRDEHGNPIPPTPPSIPLNNGEDDEDDIPYRLMDYPRPPQQSQNVNSNSLLPIAGAGLGRKPRTVAEIRAAPIANKK